MKDNPMFDKAINELLEGIEKDTGSKIRNFVILDQTKNGLVFVAAFENGKCMGGHINAQNLGKRLQLRCQANFL